jgi:hypothetical protein
MTSKITIFCAVWHQDPDRFLLLKEHEECLDRQTIEVNRVYIFDAGDTPPTWLKGDKVVSSQKLTIYEAWNFGLVNIKTPYVMNLNLDDRISPECCQLYVDALDEGADLVGGEWEICFSQPDTDSITFEKSIESLPFYPDWPPLPGRKVRLGSGTGERGTHGPACAWKLDLHIQIPRYPHRFIDNTPVKVIGDAIWWMILKSNKKNLVRLRNVVGKYHSHPGEQAEFRNPGDDEFKKLQTTGLRLI